MASRPGISFIVCTIALPTTAAVCDLPTEANCSVSKFQNRRDWQLRKATQTFYESTRIFRHAADGSSHSGASNCINKPVETSAICFKPLIRARGAARKNRHQAVLAASHKYSLILRQEGH